MQAFFIGPKKAPLSVKVLMWTTVFLSLFSPVLTFFMAYFFKASGPVEWLGLSLPSLEKGWVWQFFTYIFLNSTHTTITLSLFFSLLFLMLLLWFAGSEVTFRIGERAFLFLYFGAAIFAALVSSAILYFTSSLHVLVGSAPPLFATMMIFAMLYPNLELFFFVFFKIKAKWLVLAVFGLSLLMSLSSGDFITAIAEISAIFFAYLVGRFLWKFPNPYPLKHFATKKEKRATIIDISTFQEDDDTFMDKMLAKIARTGESSLTKKEKERMQQISLRKKRS